MPRLASIQVFPLKSLDGVSLGEAVLTSAGALAGDREYALRGSNGLWLNGKRCPRLLQLRARWSLPAWHLQIQAPGSATATFHLPTDSNRLAAWISDWLGEPATIERDPLRGIPDDPDAPGPTILSTETLAEVAGWFPGLSTGELRRRFRANLEISGGGPFWEDRLIGENGAQPGFRIGHAGFAGLKTCARCSVPARDSLDGTLDPAFARTFSDRRRATLPPWAPPARFDHTYRLAINTRTTGSSAGTRISVGDEVRLDP